MMALSASLGNFCALTVLMRSGMSVPLSFFMLIRNLCCCISLMILIDLTSSSICLVSAVLDLVKISQSTKDSSPTAAKIDSKLP